MFANFRNTALLAGLCAMPYSMFLMNVGEARADWLPAAPGNHRICNRAVTMDSAAQAFALTGAEQAGIRNGTIWRKDFGLRGSRYQVGYIVSEVNLDPELVMGVYSATARHAGSNGLGDFILATRDYPVPAACDSSGKPCSNVWEVYYKQKAEGFMFIEPADPEYVLRNTLTRKTSAYGTAYELDSRLIKSTNEGFSPLASDGFMRVESNGRGGSFVIACNYMVARNPVFAGDRTETYVQTASERLTLSARRFVAWLNRVAKGPTSGGTVYRNRLTRLLAGPLGRP